MLILAVADLPHHRVRVLARIAINQLLVAVLAISLTVVAAAGIVTGDLLTVGTISWATVLIGAGYVVGMRIICANRPGPPFQTAGEAEIAEQRAARLAPSVAIFTGAALVILVAARYLASSAGGVAGALGISTPISASGSSSSIRRLGCFWLITVFPRRPRLARWARCRRSARRCRGYRRGPSSPTDLG